LQVPSIGPRRANSTTFQGYDFVLGALLVTVALIHPAVIASALGLIVSGPGSMICSYHAWRQEKYR